MKQHKANLAFEPSPRCPLCNRGLYVNANPRLGDAVMCLECGASLEVVQTRPIAVDFLIENGILGDLFPEVVKAKTPGMVLSDFSYFEKKSQENESKERKDNMARKSKPRSQRKTRVQKKSQPKNTQRKPAKTS